MPLPPAFIFPFDAQAEEVLLYTGAAVLRGWNIKEATGSAAASCVLYDGTTQTTLDAGDIDLLPNESTREWFPDNGILLRTGAFLLVTGGEVVGSLFLTPISHADDVSWAFGESGPYFVHGGV